MAEYTQSEILEKAKQQGIENQNKQLAEKEKLRNDIEKAEKQAEKDKQAQLNRDERNGLVLDQNVFVQSHFEQQLFYRPESESHKVISAKLKEIVGRLLQDDIENGRVSLDDFYFTGMDTNMINACFIPKINTINGKYVIAVSRGAIDLCETEDELAAFVSHEMGHYIHHENLLWYHNSIIQEQVSDIYGLKALYNAGYDPKAMQDIQEKIINNDSKKYKASFVEKYGDPTHGPMTARKFNVETALGLAKLAMGSQVLSATADKESYANLKKALELSAEQDVRNNKINSYVYRNMVSKIPNWNDLIDDLKKENKKINSDCYDDLIKKTGIKERLDILLQINNTGQNDTRAGNYIQIFNDIMRDIKAEQDINTKQQCIKTIQDQYRTWYLNNGNFPANPFRLDFSIGLFGEFKDLYEAFDRFVTSYDSKEEAIKNAKIIKELKRYYNGVFGDADLKSETGKRYRRPDFETQGWQVGDSFPWVKLRLYNDPDINEVINAYYSHYKLPDLQDDNTRYTYFGYDYSDRPFIKDYYLDRDSKEYKILYTGDDAKKAYEKDKQLANMRAAIEYQKNFDKDLDKRIDILNVLYDYSKGKLTLYQLDNKLNELHDSHKYSDFLYSLDHIDKGGVVFRCPYCADFDLSYFVDTLNNKAKKLHFYKEIIEPKLKSFSNIKRITDVNGQSAVEIVLNNNRWMTKPTTGDRIVWDFIKDMYNNVFLLESNPEIMFDVANKILDDLPESYDHYSWSRWGEGDKFFDAGWWGYYYVHHEEPRDENLLNLLSEITEKARTLTTSRLNEFKHTLLKKALKDPRLGLPNFIVDAMNTEIASEFKQNATSIEKDRYTKSKLKSLGIVNMPKTNPDLDKAINRLKSLTNKKYLPFHHYTKSRLDKHPSSSSRYYTPENYKIDGYVDRSWGIDRRVTYINDYIFIVWAEYLKHGGEYYSPIKFIHKHFDKHNDNENNSALNYAENIERSEYLIKCPIEAARDILAKNITEKYFKSLNLKDKLELYEFMDARGLFFDKYANKNVFAKLLVNDLVKIKISDEDIKQDRYPENVEIVERLLSGRGITGYGNVITKPLTFANEREKLCEYYAEYWARKLGCDESSRTHKQDFSKYQDVATYIKQKFNIGRKEYNLFPSATIDNIFDKISNKVLAQEDVAKIFAVSHGYNPKELEKYALGVFFSEKLIELLDGPSIRKLIHWLREDYNYENFEKIVKNYEEDYAVTVPNRSKSMEIHEHFWLLPPAGRMVCMSRLLTRYIQATGDTGVELVLNELIGNNEEFRTKYYDDAKLIITSLYNNCSEEKNLLLSGMLSASKNNAAASLEPPLQQIGRALKTFFQAKGDAFIKFGQMLSYLNELPQEIRDELAGLRDKAGVPSRSAIFDLIKDTLPKEHLDKISRVEEVLGAGSLYVTAKVIYDGKPRVLAFMRRGTIGRTKMNLDLIVNSVNDIAKANPKFEILKNIVEKAAESCATEIDINKDYEKFKDAYNTYKHFKIKLNGKDVYNADAAKWVAYGQYEKSDEQHPEVFAWKIMELAPGTSLIDMKPEDLDKEQAKNLLQQKHDFAKAYLTHELCQLVSGQRSDTDRHQGQQNFSYNPDFQEFLISIFDTGARLNEAPNNNEKEMFGHFLVELIFGVIEDAKHDKKTKLADSLNVAISKSKQKETENVGASYIENVRRALLTLSDIIEYQKPYTDKDGIMQPGESLTKEDLSDVVIAVMKSGIMDKHVKSGFKNRLIDNTINVFMDKFKHTTNKAIKVFMSKIKQSKIDDLDDNPTITLQDVIKACKTAKDIWDKFTNKSKDNIIIEYVKDIQDLEELAISLKSENELNIQKSETETLAGGVNANLVSTAVIKDHGKESASVKKTINSDNGSVTPKSKIASFNRGISKMQLIINATKKIMEKIKEQQSNSGLVGGHENV